LPSVLAAANTALCPIRELGDAQEQRLGRDIEALSELHQSLNLQLLILKRREAADGHQQLSSGDVAEEHELPLIGRRGAWARSVPDSGGVVGEEGVREFVGDRETNAATRARRIELDANPASRSWNDARVVEVLARHERHAHERGQLERVIGPASLAR
jgi:hypothetical protein